MPLSGSAVPEASSWADVLGSGDQQGHCELSGGALCLQQVVCGCDGQTYSSACAAHSDGIDTMSTTSCIPGNGDTGAPCGQDTDCMSGYKRCVTGGTAGSPIACRQIPSGGSCPALPQAGSLAIAGFEHLAS